ncbi:MAG: glycosyltransferase family 4 protein [Epsilonproteobacteria bacterium]|nr:glycosyltransferase family 4 protein [Campylobacterota bacterium]
MISRLITDKGLEEYLKAAKLLKEKYSNNIEFLLVGTFYNGNPTMITKKYLDQWIKKGVVNYLGSSDDVKKIISESDCIVLPSYREGLSRVLLEAAAMARPIVTTNVTGCKEVVDNNVNGFLCEPKNYIDLADKMDKIFHLSKMERLQMGKKGREKIVKEFNEEIVINKYLQAIRKLVNKS